MYTALYSDQTGLHFCLTDCRLCVFIQGTGPTSVRVLSFFSGVMLCTVAVLNAIIGNIFINFNRKVTSIIYRSL